MENARLTADILKVERGFISHLPESQKPERKGVGHDPPKTNNNDIVCSKDGCS